MGHKVAATLPVQALQHALSASKKLGEWRERLCERKKRGLVRTALRRRVFAEMCQMLKKGERHYARDERCHGAKMARYRNFEPINNFV